MNDVGVVGVPDEYAGEIPLAFVSLSQNAIERLKQSPNEADAIKKSICKVSNR